jgi:hypothetical protein
MRFTESLDSPVVSVSRLTDVGHTETFLLAGRHDDDDVFVGVRREKIGEGCEERRRSW